MSMYYEHDMNLKEIAAVLDVPLGTLRAVAIIDEALTFNLPPKLEETIHKLCRSKGVCIVAGAQRLPDPQLDERGAWRNAAPAVHQTPHGG